MMMPEYREAMYKAVREDVKPTTFEIIFSYVDSLWKAACVCVPMAKGLMVAGEKDWQQATYLTTISIGVFS